MSVWHHMTVHSATHCLSLSLTWLHIPSFIQLGMLWPSVWPDLTKFSHFGKVLKIFGNFLRVYLVFGKILNPLWKFQSAFGPIHFVVNGRILRKHSRHLVTLKLAIYVLSKIGHSLSHILKDLSLSYIVCLSLLHTLPISFSYILSLIHIVYPLLWPNWAIFLKLLDSNFLIKLPKYLMTFGAIWKISLWSKNWCSGHFLGKFWKNWATFYLNIWSPCVSLSFSPSPRNFLLSIVRSSNRYSPEKYVFFFCLARNYFSKTWTAVLLNNSTQWFAALKGT